MRNFKNIFRLTWLFLGMMSAAVFVLAYSLDNSVSDTYKITVADEFTFKSPVPVTAVFEGKNLKTDKKAGDVYKVDLKMFGVIPFSSTTVTVVDKKSVAVLGTPFGMRLYTDGVLVTDLSEISTGSGSVCPAKSAGIKVGDYIKSVDGVDVECNEDLSDLVVKSNGGEMSVKIVRNGKHKTVKLVPVLDKDTKVYRAGIWVRDSSAGIGTLTFYSPSEEVICGLGHGICDTDTGKILSLNSGEIVTANIVTAQKGKSGEPGELKGKFTYKVLSETLNNREDGVYGTLCGNIDASALTEVANKQDIKDGEAQILTTVKGDSPKAYACKIKVCDKNSKTQNILITVTDKRLISLTGGIIQGMSGSPVLQNGRLIGAITHVLVDDPTTGYAIFAENMLETAQSVANSEKLRDAS